MTRLVELVRPNHCKQTCSWLKPEQVRLVSRTSRFDNISSKSHYFLHIINRYPIPIIVQSTQNSPLSSFVDFLSRIFTSQIFFKVPTQSNIRWTWNYSTSISSFCRCMLGDDIGSVVSTVMGKSILRKRQLASTYHICIFSTIFVTKLNIKKKNIGG